MKESKENTHTQHNTTTYIFTDKVCALVKCSGLNRQGVTGNYNTVGERSSSKDPDWKKMVK